MLKDNLYSDYELKYPSKIKLFTDTDQYFKLLWESIDKANDSIFIITYCMDNHFIANFTLKKLIKKLENNKIPIVLLIEHLNYYPNKELLDEFVYKGGIVIKPNRVERIFSHIKNFELKNFFNRTHQKLSLIDSDLFIGSSNIAKEYSGSKYGISEFYDLNAFIQNTPCYFDVILLFKNYMKNNFDSIRIFNYKSFMSTYNRLEKLLINKNVNDKLKHCYYSPLKSNFDFYFPKINFRLFEFSSIKKNVYLKEKFLEENPPYTTKISESVVKLIREAKKEIILIQPYYLRLKIIDDSLIDAQKRGVKVTIFTSFKRDQPAYKHLYNRELFGHLIKENIEVKEYMYKFLHMKAYYIDGEILNFGSMNNDITSFQMNNEANYMIYKDEHNEAFQQFNTIVSDLDTRSRDVSLYYPRFNLFRWISNKWWYFFIWSMQKTVTMRSLD